MAVRCREQRHNTTDRYNQSSEPMFDVQQTQVLDTQFTQDLWSIPVRTPTRLHEYNQCDGDDGYDDTVMMK